MNGDRDVLERFGPLFPPPSDSFEQLLQLRDRKRRNRRIGALALASFITIFLLGSLLTASIGSRQLSPRPEPAIRPTLVGSFHMLWMGKTAGDPAGAISLAGLNATGDSLYVVSSDDARLSSFPLDCTVQGGRCHPAWTASIPVRMGACHPVECIGSTPAGPAVADGLIFVGSLHHLTAFPADCPSACKPVWTARTNAIAHQAVVADGVVYVGTGDGYLYAFPVTCQRRCEPLWVSQRQRSSLAVSQVQDGVIYASTDPVWGNAVPDPSHDAVYAFPTRCGSGCEPLWTAPLPGNDDMVAPLAVSGGTIYVAGSEEEKPVLNAYRATCGMALECRTWSAILPGSAEHPLVTEGGEVVVTVPSAGEVLAYPTRCANACEPVWTAPVPGIMGRAVLGDGLVFVGSTEGVAAIPLPCGSEGVVCQPTWVSDHPAGALAVTDGTLFVRSPNGAVRAFAPTAA